MPPGRVERAATTTVTEVGVVRYRRHGPNDGARQGEWSPWSPRRARRDPRPAVGDRAATRRLLAAANAVPALPHDGWLPPGPREDRHGVGPGNRPAVRRRSGGAGRVR